MVVQRTNQWKHLSDFLLHFEIEVTFIILLKIRKHNISLLLGSFPSLLSQHPEIQHGHLFVFAWPPRLAPFLSTFEHSSVFPTYMLKSPSNTCPSQGITFSLSSPSRPNFLKELSELLIFSTVTVHTQ